MRNCIMASAWAAVCALSLVTIATPANAQAKPFQAELKSLCDALSCRVTSVLVPANRRLQIEEVSCKLIVNGTGAAFLNQAAVVDSAGAEVRKVGFLTGERFSVLGTTVSFIRQPTLIFLNAGQRLQLRFDRVNTPNAMSASCTISGFMSSIS